MEYEALTPEQKKGETRVTDFLGALGVGFEMHRHPEVFTVEEAQQHTAHLPGAHVKNMFLKDKESQLWLVTCLDERSIKIKDLEKALGARKMSFGKPELLWEALAVRPGSVTPLALLTDKDALRVRFVLDQALVGAPIINCHPMHNAATLALSADGLALFTAAVAHEPIHVDFDALEAKALARS